MQLDKLGDTIDEVLAKTGTRKLTASQRIVILGCVGGFIPAQPVSTPSLSAKAIIADLKNAALRDLTDWRLWLPISTAPRDKTRILLYADTTDNPAWPTNYIQFGYYERGKWHVENNGDYNYGGHGEDYETGPHSIDCPGYIHPTHWQAIPEPPK